MSAESTISNFLLLPETKIIKTLRKGASTNIYFCEKKKTQEYCPYCASGEYWTHQYRVVTAKDTPIRGKEIILKVRKRRLKCNSCLKVFNDPIPGILGSEIFERTMELHQKWVNQLVKGIAVKDLKTALEVLAKFEDRLESFPVLVNE